MSFDNAYRERELLISLTVDGGNEFLSIQLGAPFYQDPQPRELKLSVVLTTQRCELGSVAGRVAVQVKSIDGKDYWTATFDLLVPAEQESQIVRVPIGKRFNADPVIHVSVFCGYELHRRCDCILA